MRTRSGKCAASFVMVLMCASFPGARQNERAQAIETGFRGAQAADIPLRQPPPDIRSTVVV